MTIPMNDISDCLHIRRIIDTYVIGGSHGRLREGSN